MSKAPEITPLAAPKVLVATDAVDVVELRSLVIINCHGPVGISDLDALIEIIPQAAHRRTEPISLLLLLAEGAATLLDDDIRARCVALSKLLEPLAKAKAYVVEGDGFARSGVRIAISTIQMLSRASCPCKIFGEVRPALEWLAQEDTAIRQGELRSLTALLTG